MTADALLLSQAQDKFRQAQKRGSVTHTPFLTAPQSLLLQQHFSNKREVCTLFFGGYPDAERRVCFFVPAPQAQAQAVLQEHLQTQKPLALLCVEKDAFSAPGHRDYLGALMGLGVKREMLGDLLVQPDGCDLPVLREVVPFLLAEFTQAGKATLRVHEGELAQIRAPLQDGQAAMHTVASLRLDCVAAQVFRLSRTAAQQAITAGLLLLNDRPQQKGEKTVEPGDKLTLRGTGKVELVGVAGVSKKGKIRLEVLQFLKK